jgi:hypothetical protein
MIRLTLNPHDFVFCSVLKQGKDFTFKCVGRAFSRRRRGCYTFVLPLKAARNEIIFVVVFFRL